MPARHKGSQVNNYISLKLLYIIFQNQQSKIIGVEGVTRLLQQFCLGMSQYQLFADRISNLIDDNWSQPMPASDTLLK